MNRYLTGSEILGAGLPQGGQQYVLVKLKNLSGLVKSQAGASGALALKLVPNTITNTVYTTLQQKLIDGFKEQGVDADVTVVSTPPTNGQPPSDLLQGMVGGAALVGIGWAAWHYLLHGLLSRKK